MQGDANKQVLTLNLNIFCRKKNLPIWENQGTPFCPIWDPNLPTKNCRSPYLSLRKDHMYGLNKVDKFARIRS